jgi:hypothetical protein
MRFLLTSFLLGSILTGCSSSTKFPNEAPGATADGPCAPEFRSHLAKYTDEDAELLAKVVLAGIGESCRGLPERVTEIIDLIMKSQPADGATLMMSALEEERSFARLGCPSFEAARDAMLAAPGADRARVFFQRCELGRLNLVTEAEMDTAWKTDVFATGIFAAPSLYVWLVEHRMTKAEARKLSRLLMGL